MNNAKSVADENWFNDPGLGRIFALLNQEGREVRVVGGAVRNALMELPVTDTDLATTWPPAEVIARAQAAGIRVVPTGIDHGTVTLVIDGRGFEVTTLRHDAKTDGRHATVVFGSDWQTDAERRDFTINALYADQSGAIIDLIGGLDDIETRTVRFIGDPDDRIAEDHLRILRYFRFFAHYGAGRPDAAALKACARARDSLVKLSSERVWKELKTLLKARDPGRALLWMRQAGVLSLVLPESEKWGIDSVSGLIGTETALGWDPDPMLRLMAIVPPDAARMREMSGRLKMSRNEADRLSKWCEAPAIAPTLAITALDRLLYRHGAGPIIDRIRLALISARARADTDPASLTEAAGHNRHLVRAKNWECPVFPVKGSDLIAQGAEPGPALGARLAALEERWIESNFTLDKQALLAGNAD